MPPAVASRKLFCCKKTKWSRRHFCFFCFVSLFVLCFRSPRAHPDSSKNMSHGCLLNRLCNLKYVAQQVTVTAVQQVCFFLLVIEKNVRSPLLFFPPSFKARNKSPFPSFPLVFVTLKSVFLSSFSFFFLF